MKVELRPHQVQAIREMKNKCILAGEVGSGKSITAIAYFFVRVMGGRLEVNGGGGTKTFTNKDITKLLIITPAKKKKDLEWELETSRFGLGRDKQESFGGIEVVVDSWHNITKHTDTRNAFIIFDEQKLVGSGAWVKAFHKIAAHNPWIVLSATPGDVWMDFVPIFIENGFYRNRTDFCEQHVVWSRYSKFPKVEKYFNEARLLKFKADILVEMPFERHTVRKIVERLCSHDLELYKRVDSDRWNPWDEQPIENPSQWVHALRKAVNTHVSRLVELDKVLQEHPKLIIFYSFTYELNILRNFLKGEKIKFAEWNGENHHPVPVGDKWVYLVQYTAGNDGWNCVTTNAMAFYSLQYSYKVQEQCMGRTDRLNTKYTDLYYYILKSNSKIDFAIWKALVTKKKFSEKKFAGELFEV